MTENKMYSQRSKHGNIPVMRYCGFSCVYCAFQKFQKISSCQKCRAGENHSHTEVLQRTPPKTKDGEFLTVGLAGDISFMPLEDFWQVIEYCRKWKDRTYMIQSKNPAYFLRFDAFKIKIPDNVILGTTIETNRIYLSYPDTTKDHYSIISQAPYTYLRWLAMLKLTCRKAVTIEPIMDFSGELLDWIISIKPEFCYVGYCNDGNQGKRLKLPEPPLAKTMELIARLREAGIEVREKTLRLAWWEQ